MPGPLDALALAARGLRVFPLVPGGRVPYPGSRHVFDATSDAGEIIARFREDDNIGVLTSDLVVVDIDVKGGKDGWSEYLNLCCDTDTFSVDTPSGGRHLYFSGGPARQRPLAPGVDIRSHNGYVIGPGSVVGGRHYTIVREGPRAPVPAEVAARLVAVSAAKDRGDVVEGGPASLALARMALRTCAPSIEGKNGHDAAFKALARAKDFGVDQAQALDLALAEFNPRCEPPFDVEELSRIVENVFRYSQNPQGIKLAPFAAVKLPPRPEASDVPSVFAHPLDIDARVSPEWAFRGFAERRELTLLSAAGGTGKSALTILAATLGAAGKDFLGFRCEHPLRTAIWNAEDTHWRQAQRFHAACHHNGLDAAALSPSILLGHSASRELRVLLEQSGRAYITHNDRIERLVGWVREANIDLLALDPLASMHACDENDNGAMSAVIDILREIAAAANVALLLVHHTSKSGSGAPGVSGAARGASAIVNGVRYAFSLTRPSPEDKMLPQIGNDWRFVRLDSAKVNHAEQTDEPLWLYKYGVTLPFSDHQGRQIVSVALGAPAQAPRPISQAELREAAARSIVAAMHRAGTASMRAASAAVTVAALPEFADKPMSSVRDWLKRTFEPGIDVDGVTIRYDVNAEPNVVLVE